MQNEEQNLDIFIRYNKFPDVQNIFDISIPSIETIKGDCLFVLDTNVLLKPYEAKSEDLKEIKAVYKKLIVDNRLLIPGQVVREFIDNRPLKIKTINQSLTRHQERISEASKNKFLKIDYEKYPLLSDIPEFKYLTDLEDKLNNKADEIQNKIKDNIIEYNLLLDEYKNKFSTFKKKVDNWNWRDPISMMYAELFKKEVIVEFDFSQKSQVELIEELNHRYSNNIPPGYKDRGKDDKGVGDLIIWFTILQIAKKDFRDIVLVGGDEKTDWFLRSEDRALYPRFELINEFKNVAPNSSFSIIKFSEFLEIFKVSPDTVKRLDESPKALFSYFSEITSKALNALIEWFEKNNLAKSFYFEKSQFPDLIISTDMYERVAVELKILHNVNTYSKHNIFRFKEVVYRGLYEVTQNKYDKFFLVIVLTKDPKAELESIINVCHKLYEMLDNTESLSIIVGVLTEDNIFEHLKTIG